ncbi:hypothetical protein [Oscillatoria sp. FACHB-1406]|uniref:hypothetical protein n=1 Tax=Oscillatoria sp. FACHB-1406 TaxID=2692846 RepID=UPI001689BF54|nr:hypothetical protein [Oscillatoria sp. FACHB-1406]MBD2577462.1 hypothetical protein [Oscillatoria sp. FACHB-1406]
MVVRVLPSLFGHTATYFIYIQTFSQVVIVFFYQTLWQIDVTATASIPAIQQG